MRSDMYVNSVLEKCKLFGDCNLWSSEPKVRPKAWLQNFDEEERPIAAVLLDHFIFFGAIAVDQMLLTGFRRLQARIRQFGGEEALNDFSRQVIFTAVCGEDPNPTDSGPMFCRKVRQLLALPDDRFKTLEKALHAANNGVPIVFLDDFIGSGDQMLFTWEQDAGPLESFKSLSEKNFLNVSYLSLVSTSKAHERLREKIPSLRLVYSHLADRTYSVYNLSNNPIRPDIENIPEKINDLLEKYYPKLNLPQYLTTVPERKFGYKEQGFLIAFDHSIPDASLPLFWATASTNWTPLVRRA